MNVVEVHDLVKRYKELVALDHFELSIQKGEIFGLLGPNGSGKTTAINCILQLLSYDKGSIQVFGEPMAPQRYDIKRRIGIVPQNIAAFPQLSVYENIDYFCSLYVDDRARRKQLVQEAIAFVGLEDYLKFRPRKLSGGLVRRLNIACGIAHKPELIFFDEPTVAVDPQSRNAILEGIQRLNREGSTIVYTSHYMEEVERICTNIMIMDRGQALATGSNTELKRMVDTGEKIEIELAESYGLDVDEYPADNAATPASPTAPHPVHIKTAPDAPVPTIPGTPATPVLALVQALPHVRSAALEGSTLRVVCSRGSNNLSAILAALKDASIEFGRVFSEPPTLNDVFLEITGKELRD